MTLRGKCALTPDWREILHLRVYYGEVTTEIEQKKTDIESSSGRRNDDVSRQSVDSIRVRSRIFGSGYADSGADSGLLPYDHAVSFECCHD